MARHSDDTRRVEFDTPLARLDVNTPEEYERGVELYGQWG